MSLGASITVQRRVEWADTDAAGHQHFTAVLRWVEEVEAVLSTRLGISDVIVGNCPRVRLEADFQRRLPPLSSVEVTLTVSAVGRTSVRYAFEVCHEGQLAAQGILVAVLVDANGPLAWPAETRAALLQPGAVSGEEFAVALVRCEADEND